MAIASFADTLMFTLGPFREALQLIPQNPPMRENVSQLTLCQQVALRVLRVFSMTLWP